MTSLGGDKSTLPHPRRKGTDLLVSTSRVSGESGRLQKCPPQRPEEPFPLGRTEWIERGYGDGGIARGDTTGIGDEASEAE